MSNDTVRSSAYSRLNNTIRELNLKKIRRRNRNATSILFLGFLFIIAVGTLLLSLPISSASGTVTNPIDSCFTAVSAVCVTGLSVVNTATYWSTFGQVVILVLIQIGGLGFMSMAVLFSMLFTKKLLPRERMLVAQSYGISTTESFTVLFRRILIGTLLIECAGAILLSIRFIPDFGLQEGIFQSVFHAVSAFCNAGFDILGRSPEIGSTAHYLRDPLVNITWMLLILLGGIGFLVWSDFLNVVRSKGKKHLSIYSRFVLLITVVLVCGGTILIMIFEWNNPNTIQELPFFEKLLVSSFQSVTLRTAGFAPLDQTALTENSKMLSLLWMFIGGASGSTAGGVKMVTIGVVIAVVMSAAAGKRNAVIFRRSVTNDHFVHAVTLIFVQLLLIVLASVAMSTIHPDLHLMSILFENVSAVSTVGLSLNLTPTLDIVSKCIVMCLMYFGRVGILSITTIVMRNMTRDTSLIQYPNANLLIG